MVAGGLAIMKQLFRDQLSNTELVTRLFETADDTGAYSNRAVYGRGKLDLAAATHPVGALEVPVAANTVRAGNNLRATRLSLGAPFGGGLARSVGNVEIMALGRSGRAVLVQAGRFRDGGERAGGGREGPRLSGGRDARGFRMAGGQRAAGPRRKPAAGTSRSPRGG